MSNIEETDIIDIQFKKRGGLIPVIVQDIISMQILMLGYANREAIQKTIDHSYATFWSTSRNELWTKGDTSGDRLLVKQLLVDCDQDSIIYLVEKEGKGSCHTKNSKGITRSSCFYRNIKDGKLKNNDI